MMNLVNKERRGEGSLRNFHSRGEGKAFVRTCKNTKRSG